MSSDFCRLDAADGACACLNWSWTMKKMIASGKSDYDAVMLLGTYVLFDYLLESYLFGCHVENFLSGCLSENCEVIVFVVKLFALLRVQHSVWVIR